MKRLGGVEEIGQRAAAAPACRIAGATAGGVLGLAGGVCALAGVAVALAVPAGGGRLLWVLAMPAIW